MKRLILAGAMLAFSIYAGADELTGRVTAVADGDTITILDASNTQYKVRLLGIDAPEKHQEFSSAAKKSLSDMILDKEVTVNFKQRGRYQYIAGKVLLNGIDVNLEQIKRGMAWCFKHYLNEQAAEDQSEYARAQATAEDNHLGLWAEKEPIPPWEFRMHGNTN